MNLDFYVAIKTALGITLVGAGAAFADSVEDFYRGNTVTLVVSAAPGGASDFFARQFGDYFGRHIPGQPTVIVVNQAGAGGMIAAAQLQTNQPNDGTVVAILQKNNLYRPLLEGGAQFDPREVNWIGSLNKDEYVIAAWEDSPVLTAEAIFEDRMILGATGFANENRTLPAMMNDFMGAQFEIIHGYSGSEEIGLAMERGEVDGKVATVNNLVSGSEAPHVEAGRIKILLNLALTPTEAFPDVPNLSDFIEDEEVRALVEFLTLPFESGRPLAVPKGLPPERLDALRQAFDDAVVDPEFIAHMESLNSALEPVQGTRIEEIIAALYDTPPSVLDEARTILTAE